MNADTRVRDLARVLRGLRDLAEHGRRRAATYRPATPGAASGAGSLGGGTLRPREQYIAKVQQYLRPADLGRRRTSSSPGLLLAASGRVAGDLVHGHPHHDPDRARLVGLRVLPVVLPRQRGIHRAPDVGRLSSPGRAARRSFPGRRRPARSRSIRGSRSMFLCFTPPFDGREQHVVAVPADPHRGGLRAAVGVHGGKDRVVLPVEQSERLGAERNSHARTVTRRQR